MTKLLLTSRSEVIGVAFQPAVEIVKLFVCVMETYCGTVGTVVTVVSRVRGL